MRRADLWTLVPAVVAGPMYGALIDDPRAGLLGCLTGLGTWFLLQAVLR